MSLPKVRPVHFGNTTKNKKVCFHKNINGVPIYYLKEEIGHVIKTWPGQPINWNLIVGIVEVDGDLHYLGATIYTIEKNPDKVTLEGITAFLNRPKLEVRVV